MGYPEARQRNAITVQVILGHIVVNVLMFHARRVASKDLGIHLELQITENSIALPL